MRVICGEVIKLCSATLLICCLVGCKSEPPRAVGHWIQLDSKGNPKAAITISPTKAKVYFPGNGQGTDALDRPVFFKNQPLWVRNNYNIELTDSKITVLLQDDTEPVGRIGQDIEVSSDAKTLIISEEPYRKHVPTGIFTRFVP